MRRFDYGIVGGGFAGLSTAFFLLKKRAGTVCLVEKERAPGLMASGQNASMMCQAAADPAVSEMTARGVRLFKKEFLGVIPGIGFRECGSLFLGEDGAPLAALEKNARREGFPAVRMNRRRTLARFPFLVKSSFDEALFFPRDGVVNIRSLTAGLARFFIKSGGALLLGKSGRLQREKSGFSMRAGGGGFRFRRVVNAAGAWAGTVAREAGAQEIPVRAKRRHIFILPPRRWVNPDWPIVWDASREIYFRPMGLRLLFSPCDEEDYPAGPVKTSPAAWALLQSKMGPFLPRARRIRHEVSWAGLRAFAPDSRFVIGPDAKVEHFFWAAGLGGHGLTACASVGELAALLAAGKSGKIPSASCFSPARF